MHRWGLSGFRAPTRPIKNPSQRHLVSGWQGRRTTRVWFIAGLLLVVMGNSPRCNALPTTPGPPPQVPGASRPLNSGQPCRSHPPVLDLPLQGLESGLKVGAKVRGGGRATSTPTWPCELCTYLRELRRCVAAATLPMRREEQQLEVHEHVRMRS